MNDLYIILFLIVGAGTAMFLLRSSKDGDDTTKKRGITFSKKENTK